MNFYLRGSNEIVLARDIGPRNIWRFISMPATVDYLEKVPTDLGYTVRQQEFLTYNVTALNLEQLDYALQVLFLTKWPDGYRVAADCLVENYA